MADWSPTATAVKEGTNAQTVWGYAGAAVARGKAVYLDSADNEYKLCDCTDAAKDACAGIALVDAADGQAMKVLTGGNLTADNLTAGEIYVLSEAGALSPEADLTTDDYVTVVGVATSTTNLLVPTSGPIVSSYKLT